MKKEEIYSSLFQERYEYSAHALVRQKWWHNAVLESEREHAKSDTNAYIFVRIGIFSHGDIRHAIDLYRGVHLFINIFFPPLHS